MAKEIKNFLEKNKKPDELIRGHVTEISEDTITIDLDKEFNFSKGDFVLVNHKHGSVVDAYGLLVKIELKEDPSEFEDKNVNIDTSLINTLANRLGKTISKIEKNNLDKNNIKVLDFVMGKGKPVYSDENVILINDDLNSSQHEAVSSSVNAKDFHLVIGPPGTGKTLVISEIIQQLVLKSNKILLTAYTNSAVDNIIERFNDLDIQILRIGSDISPSNLKYSINERRKNHSEWTEIKRLDNLTALAYENINSLMEEKYAMNEVISKIISRRKYLQNNLKNLMKIREKYLNKVEIYGSGLEQRDNGFFEAKKQKEILENNASVYYEISKQIAELTKVESALPDTERFYELKSGIRKMHYTKFLKRLTSIFNKETYHEFLDELNNKEAVYGQMVNSYNDYWDMYDSIKEKYDEIYFGSNGNPDKDALDSEVKLFEQLDEYLPLKNKNTQQNLELSKNDLILELYKRYLTFIDLKVDALEAEIEELKTETILKDKNLRKINNKIKNIEESIYKYKMDKKSLMDYIDSNIIEEANIIASTVDSSTKSILDSILFDYVIMDEASQVAVYKSLMPLLQCKKFILVGDDKQLQPIKEDDLSKELNQSIFNRLIEKYGDSSTFLDIQYRMNKKIADIASSLFYSGKLRTFEGIADQCLDCKIDSDLVDPNVPLTFLDTSDLDYYEDEFGEGCENTKEAQLVAKIVSEFLESGIRAEDIGIITPYTKHKKNIQRQLADKEVKVDTVYGFQGKEKDIIIMSFCRSKSGTFGPYLTRFIEQPTQVNVAITRAKKKFIMIGNSRTLKQSKLLGNVIEMMENNELELINS